MNRNKELAKNTVYLTIGKISTQFISFLLLPLYTSVLTKSEYGTVDLINTYQQLLVFVVFLQIEQGIFRYLVETRKTNDIERQKGIISSAVAVALIASGIFTLLYIVFQGLVDTAYVIFILTNVLAVSFSGLALQIARGFGDNISYVLGSFLSAVSTIVFNIIFVGVLRVGPGGMLTSIFLGNIVCIIVLMFRCHIYRYISLKSVGMDIAKELLLYSIPLVPNAIAWWIISASDRTIVLLFLGPAFNGLLAISHKFSTVFSSVFQIFNLAWTETASLHINDSDRAEFFTDIINKAMMLFGCLCVGIIAAMPFAFDVLVNKEYADAYYQIPLFMFAAFLNTVQGLYSVVYIALKQTKKVAYSTIAAAIVNVLTCFLLIEKIGLFAAPVSMIVAYVVIILYRYFDLQKSISTKLYVKQVVIFAVLMAVTLISYYLGNWMVKLLVLVLVAVLSVRLNKELLWGSVSKVLAKFRR